MTHFYRGLFLSIFLLISSAQAIAQTADFSLDGRFCVGDTIYFINESAGEDYVMWDFGDDRQSYKDNPQHWYDSAGVYTVWLYAYQTGGSFNSTSQEITINPPPDLFFVYSEEDLTIYDGQAMQIEAQGDFSTIEWSTGSTSYEISVTQAGTYSATAIDENGCRVSKITESVVVKPPPTENDNRIQVINNIITPNADGFNDFLIIDERTEYANPIVMVIYNVWGDKVYENADYREGRWNGEGLDAGTYYYHLKSEGKQGVTGFVDILK